MISRRGFALGTSAVAFSLGQTGFALARGETLDAALVRIEAKSGGRLGVAMLDTANNSHAGHRTNERFPMCSTFKLLAGAAILARVDAGKEKLDRRIPYEKKDLIKYSPATEKHAGDGMTLAGLCEAAITVSDNTAANLLLANLGGPQGLTAFARSIGDTTTRLDRNEPTLNEAKPGDARDTTTPAAMAQTIRKLVLGDALSAASRDQLKAWMLACKTGDERLRAGVPSDWTVGDKTGTGAFGTTNDIGIIWPVGRAPIVVTAYLTGTQVPLKQRSAALASVARAITDATNR